MPDSDGANSTASSIDPDLATTGPPDDEQIYCPVCGYNLTGNRTGRCSECGALFDRDKLIEARRRGAEGVMPWEHVQRYSFRQRFWRTMVVSCIRPERFAMALAAQPKRSRSWSFFVLCLGLTWFYVLGLAGVLRGPPTSSLGEWLLDAGALFVLLLVPLIAAHAAVAATCALLVRLPDRSRRWGPWWSVVQYASSHWTLIWASLVVVGPLLILADSDLDLILGLLGPMFYLGCGLLWACTISAVVASRLRASPGRFIPLTIVIVPAVVAWVASVFLLVFLVSVATMLL